MATVKPILNTKYQPKDGYYSIVIRLINGKKQKLHPLNERVKESYWTGEQVSKKHPDHKRINGLIDIEISKAKTYFAECKIKNIPIDLDLVFKEIKSHGFTDYLRHRSKQHKEAGQIEMEYKLNRYIKELTACFAREVYFTEVNQDLLRVFENYLKNQGNNNNTRHKKYEFLSKYYNNAITDGKALPPNPFKSYKIKTTPVKKEKLTPAQITAIENLQLKDGPVRLARDLFLFSYYCKGARFENCIMMQKAGITNGRLHFQTNKGMKHLSAVIHPKLKAIIDHYKKNNTDTIFGRVNAEELNKSARLKRSKLGSENAYINGNLKTVAELCKIPIALSMHHARHSVAFHLKQSTDNIHVIKDVLGHSRTQTTENYLKELDDEVQDEAMKKVYKYK